MKKDMTYFPIVFVEDIQGRTMVGRSNGVTVYLEKPNPGEVWVGTLLPVSIPFCGTSFVVLN